VPPVAGINVTSATCPLKLSLLITTIGTLSYVLFLKYFI